MEFDVNNLITKDKKVIPEKDEKEKEAGGRPPLPKDQKKDKKVMAYFTAKEKEALQALAENQNLSLSNLVRISALSAIKQD